MYLFSLFIVGVGVKENEMKADFCFYSIRYGEQTFSGKLFPPSESGSPATYSLSPQEPNKSKSGLGQSVLRGYEVIPVFHGASSQPKAY